VRFLPGYFGNNTFKDIIANFSNYMGFESFLDVVRAILDIGIIAFVIYKVIQLVKETRAMQLIKGIFFIFAAKYVSKWLGLRTIEYLLGYSLELIGFTLVVLFQPELRRGLEQIGRSKFNFFLNFEEEKSDIYITAMIEELVKATTEMAKNFTGALIVIERQTKLGEFTNQGVQMDSLVSAELLINIFVPNTPLHDGATVIGDGKIKAAACILPLTDNINLSKELGTRHRAALGITEVSDAIAIVVSEETGKISFALNGGLTRNLTADTLRKALHKNLVETTPNKKRLSLWKGKAK